ncbi:YciI family protein [Microbacterium sp. KSW-18]|uniref:YciI family protein n=1 Tax=Microbacterium aquilitoris TaxID=3067307 RepID=A0ABU3GJB4_9MICO|nr:YciI family protein [Microbacterium sp. KSW-18]MDT3330772.1 YciI family protein [Microbacterium sp. KSW-18]
MPQYAVLIYTDDSAHALDASNEQLAEPNAHGDELAQSGALRAAYAFTPRELARSVRVDGVTDGPFVDSAQVVAGVYVIEADDEDAALAIAATNPAIRGAGGVEVRLIHSGT